MSVLVFVWFYTQSVSKKGESVCVWWSVEPFLRRANVCVRAHDGIRFLLLSETLFDVVRSVVRCVVECT